MSPNAAAHTHTCTHTRVGTPPRLDGSTIDYTHLAVQESDDPPTAFSYMNDLSRVAMAGRLIPCHITHTNAATHAVIKNNMHQLPTFEVGEIGTGWLCVCTGIRKECVWDVELHRCAFGLGACGSMLVWLCVRTRCVSLCWSPVWMCCCCVSAQANAGKGQGPRYCPAIEKKVFRFADKVRVCARVCVCMCALARARVCVFA